jgi:chromate reductase, NAD(P)H dehydrogenase (quinone)
VLKGPILIISGTNRPNSNALRVATIILSHYETAKIPAEIYSLAQLPKEIFEPTSYGTKPAAFVPIQKKVLDAPGLHIVTPEYNGSFPGVLKYFIDMLKFPESFDRKPVAYVGESGGLWGAMRAVEQLQMIFGYRNAYVYPDRVFLPGISKQLDEVGQLQDPALDERLAKQAQGFAKFVEQLVPSPGKPGEG